MITILEENILDNFFKFVTFLKEERYKDADLVHEKIHELLEHEPEDSLLYIHFLETDGYIHEKAYVYEVIAAAYNDLAYEFKKVKYPERYKDEKS